MMAKRLEHLGILTVRDLLYYVPFRYNDFSKTTPIAHARVGDVVTIKGTVTSMINLVTKTHKRMQQAKITDETGTTTVVWFNQPYLISVIHKQDIIAISGKMDWFGNSIVMQSPEYEILGNGKEQLHTGRLVPVYSETEGVSSKWLRGRINAILPILLPDIIDPLPESIRKHHHLMILADALSSVHFPTTQQLAEKGRERLAFDELLFMQLQSYRAKRLWETTQHAPPILFSDTDVFEFTKTLPFTLTNDQQKALAHIQQDLSRTIPMNRLLEGDVGSGKTVVAAAAMFNAWKHGLSSVLMAPTQILAEQHFETITQILKPWNIPVELVTGNSKSRFKIQDSRFKKNFKKIVNRESSILNPNIPSITIGTHALLQNTVMFNHVGLIVIDEQQRFGVGQRALLKTKGTSKHTPHLLTMTATPIPRTIALTLYGNLDISIIESQPIGRLPVKTWLIPERKRAQAYEWIKKQLDTGDRRVFIVCPFIDASESMTAVKAASKEFETLRTAIFPHIPMALLHGRLKPQEKTSILTDFREGKTKILVSTPVVEVGIDIPTATIMVIEGSERFGLSQLHQLRGRVGRGKEQAYCLLFTDTTNEETIKRLKPLETVHSGPKLAQIDLELRGAGDVFGLRQHGVPTLILASLTNVALIEETKQTLKELTENDPELSQIPLLREQLEKGTIKDVSQD